MTLRPLLNVALAAVAAVASFAHAQEPAPPVMPKVPPHTCVKPEVLNSFASQNQIRTFNRTYKAYGECINKYIESTKALADAAVAAGNNAVDEFNKLAVEIKAQNEAAPKN
jgi:hypothetical protein